MDLVIDFVQNWKLYSRPVFLMPRLSRGFGVVSFQCRRHGYGITLEGLPAYLERFRAQVNPRLPTAVKRVDECFRRQGLRVYAGADKFPKQLAGSPTHALTPVSSLARAEAHPGCARARAGKAQGSGRQSPQARSRVSPGQFYNSWRPKRSKISFGAHSTPL